MSKYDRHYCALVTPFKEDSVDIDYDAFRKHVRYFTQDMNFAKHRGSLIVNPEASEMFYFTKEERQAMIKIVLEERQPDMPIFAGVFGVTVDEAIDCALEAKKMGCDGLFMFPPTGTMEVSTAADNVNYPEIWRDWLKMIDARVDLPMILHPASPMTMEWGQSLPLSTVQVLVKDIPNIVGYKMIYGLEGPHYRVANYFRSIDATRHISILNWPMNSWTSAMFREVVDGSVQGAWNWNKEAMLQYLDAYEAQDFAELKKLVKDEIAPIWEYVYAGGTRIHVRYKIAVWLRGLCSHPFMRAPMPPPCQEEVDILYNLLKSTSQSLISREQVDATMKKQEAIISTGIHR